MLSRGVIFRFTAEQSVALADMQDMAPNVTNGNNTKSDAGADPVWVRPETEPPIPPLGDLPPGGLRSLGGYLDYSKWPARGRFMELDMAIQLSADERGKVGVATTSSDPLPTPSETKAKLKEDLKKKRSGENKANGLIIVSVALYVLYFFHYIFNDFLLLIVFDTSSAACPSSPA